MTDVTRTEVHTTTWRGRLSRDEMDAILLDALRNKLGTPRFGVTLQIDLGQPRDYAFELVHDHDWYAKPNPDLDDTPSA